MLKKILMLIAMLYAAASFAAVDVNKATAAELDGIKGIGPAISSRIMDERKKGNFKNWEDFVSRVKGVGEVSASHFSASGLTVNGSSYTGAPAKAPEGKKAAAAPAKADKAADAKPAKEAKASKDTQKADAKSSKTDAASAAAPAASASTGKK